MSDFLWYLAFLAGAAITVLTVALLVLIIAYVGAAYLRWADVREREHMWLMHDRERERKEWLGLMDEDLTKAKRYVGPPAPGTSGVPDMSESEALRIVSARMERNRKEGRL